LPVYKQMGRESCEKEYNRPIYNQQGKETIDNQYNRPSNQAQGETYPHKQQIQSILTPMKANRNYMNRICSICLAQIFFGDDITVCNKCDTAYHGECSPPGGCISKGCKVDDLPLGTIMPDIAPDEQFCTMCGNVIKKSAVKCYHCGSIVDQQFRMGRTFSQVHSNTGVIALLIGISAFLVSWCPFIGLPIGVLAIYQGSKAKQDYNQYSLGNIGYITGIIAVVLSVFVFLIFIISGITGK